MQTFFFIFLFVFTMICFFYSIISKDMVHKQLFTILSIPLFIGLAVGCLNLETTEALIVNNEVVEHTITTDFIAGSYIFAFFTVVCIINLYRYYMEDMKDE